MRPSIDTVRREAHVRWKDIYPMLKPEKGKRREMQKAAKRPPHWLCEIALCEAMRRVSNLQTDIEDFCPTQPVRAEGGAGGKA